jgi:hypothetical protein
MKRIPLAIALGTSVVGLVACFSDRPWIAPRLEGKLVMYRTATPAQDFEAARQLAWQAAVMVQHPPHPAETWQAAKVKWRQAIRLLEDIPGDAAIASEVNKKRQIYSRNYAAINQRLAAEQTAAANLELAQTLAWQAAVTSQNPPHPLSVWQRASQRWQAAIALLESIPATTSVFTQSQQKLLTYRNNQGAIQQRIVVEIRAQQLLQQFSQTAAQLTELSATAPVGITVEQIGISYQTYAGLVQNLRTSLAQFANLPGARVHPIYRELRAAIADYDNALTLWHSYLDFQQANAAWLFGDSFHQLFPLASPETLALAQQYQLETVPSQAMTPKISLKLSVWQIWQQADKHVKQAQQQFPQSG